MSNNGDVHHRGTEDTEDKKRSFTMVPQNLIYLFVAYTIVWIVLFGYIFYLNQQVGDLRKELKSLLIRRDEGRESK